MCTNGPVIHVFIRYVCYSLFLFLPLTLILFITAPIAWPTAKLLDWALGKSETHTYKKAELKFVHFTFTSVDVFATRQT